MTNLSDAAYAVFTAYNREASGKPEDHHMLEAIAAALRTAADRVVPQRRKPMYADSWEESAWTTEQDTRADLLAIAAELEEFGNR